MGVVEVSHRPRLISAATAGLLALALGLLGPLLTPSPALAAISYVSSATNHADASNLSFADPGGIQVGDLLLVQFFFDDDDANVTTFPSTGWTQVVNTPSGGVRQRIYRKFAVAGDTSAASFAFGFNQGGTVGGGILVYRGVASDPIIASNGQGGGSSPMTAPSIAALANSKLVTFFGVKKKQVTMDGPSGMDIRYTRIASPANPPDIDVSIRAADQTIVSAGATGNRTVTFSPTDRWIGQSVTLRSAPEPDPLVVEKTAVPAIADTITWDIAKSVEPEEWHLFTGDTGTSEYTIDVTKSVDTVHSVSGTITITNPASNSVDATIEEVTDVISGTIDGNPDCAVTFPHDLAPGENLVCSYSATLPDGDTRTNTATVTTSGPVDGGEDSASVNFAGVEATVDGFASVNVTDSFAENFGPFEDTDSVTYNRTFACDEDENEEGHSNTATIDETGQEAEASVTVNCYQLDVEKTVETAFTRTWEWEIEKVRLTGENGDPVDDPDEETVDNNQSFEAHYRVTLEATSNDDQHQLSGTIQITNPNPDRDADVTVTDSVNGTPADVDCPSDTVPADGGTLVCSYQVNTDGNAIENTATATLQNFDYDSEGAGTASGTTDFEGSEDVSFDDPTTEVDTCVEVSDSEDTGGILPDDACVADGLPVEFEYSRDIGGFEQCGPEEVLNIASFTNNSTPQGEAEHTVFLEVVGCGNGDDQGCTLSQGYWKTHSHHGPAPADPNWGDLADEDFFLSGKTYYEVLWTPPAGGNAYYILAHQYIAAELNMLNNADPTDAEAAFNAATVLFDNYNPGTVGGWRGNQGERQEFIQLAGTLGAYNEGTTGPGACSKDGTEGD